MKVAHLNTEKTFRGGEQQALYLMKGLVEKGIENFLICNKGALIREKAEKFLKKENILELRINGEFDFPAIFKIRNFFKKNNIDIVHCHTSHAHTAGFLSSLFLKTKTVVSRRVDFSIYKGKIKFPNKIKYSFMCDKIIAISEKIREVLLNDGISPELVSTVYSGVDVDRLKPVENTYDLRDSFKIPENAVVLLNVAALVPHKGQEFLIKSFAKVCAKYPKAFLIIAGDGKLKENPTTLRDSFRLKEKIIFAGFRTDIDKLLSLADIFVMTSVEEGLCTSILDALTLNKVVVATDAGGIPEIIKDEETGILVKKCNVDSIACGINRAIENIEYYKDKFSKGKEFVKKFFSVESMVKGNLEIYKKILNFKA